MYITNYKIAIIKLPTHIVIYTEDKIVNLNREI